MAGFKFVNELFSGSDANCEFSLFFGAASGFFSSQSFGFCFLASDAFFFGFAQVYFFLFVVLPAMRGHGEKAVAKPWEAAEGLEWEVPSPAPFHTFENPPKLNADATRIVA